VEDLTTVEKIFDLERPVFSRDFVIVDLIPTLVFTGSVAGLLLTGAPGSAPNGRDLTSGLEQVTAATLVLLVATSTVVAIVCQPSRLRIRRLLTGAWTGRYTSRLAERRRAAWRRAWEAELDALEVSGPEENSPDLQDRGDAFKRRFPEYKYFAPTQLGNAYEALRKLIPESSAPGRSGRPEPSEASLLLVHVEPVYYRGAYWAAQKAKDPIVEAIDDARFRIAAAERHTVMWAAVGVMWLWLLITHGWWVLLAFATLPIAYLAYLGAVHSVIEFNYLVEQLYERDASRKDDNAQT
jgi:hypothetical protein